MTARKGADAHGSQWTYKQGCRCETCVAGNRARRAEQLARQRAAFSSGLLDVEHGTQVAYKVGCRCDACRAGNTARMRVYAAQRKKPPPEGGGSDQG